MKIEILGTGCPKCKKLVELAEKAVSCSAFSHSWLWELL